MYGCAFVHGDKFLGVDALGWEFICILVLLFGYPFGRHFLRAIDIRRNWPVAAGRIRNLEIHSGVPDSVAPRWLRLATPMPPSYHCRATYVYLVDGALHEGWFALMAPSVTEASKLANELQDHPILIKYDPHDPSDAVLADSQVLDRLAFQDDFLLNPKVW